MTQSKTIALFYDGFERRANEGLVGYAYSELRRAARFSYRSLRKKQVHTGFYTAFLGLVASLKSCEVDVRVNDFTYARAHPREPIGIAGYPSVIGKVSLPNPIIFGPGDYGIGDAAAALATRENIKVLSHPSQWVVDINAQWVGDKGEVYFAGIDTSRWPSLSSHKKTVDFVVYDKIRWHRTERETTVLRRALDCLTARGLSYRILRYGEHHVGEFRASLANARALLFLCEHETQGIAYQEALSSGVPVLAWDEGVPVDPNIIAVLPKGVVVSSVPYFDDRCGLTFKLAELEVTLDAFQAALSTFQPRQYVIETLSLKASGARYLSLYEQAYSS